MKSASESVGSGHRSGLVLGAKSTGKTTFVASASKYAPDFLKGGSEIIDCPDVVIIQIDPEGVLGPLDVGLNPRVIDLGGVAGWQALNFAIAKAIVMLQPLVANGEVRVVGVDLGAIDREIRAYAAGDKIIPKDKLGDLDISLAAKDVNWGAVEGPGVQLYRKFRTLDCLVLGMAHLKVTNNNPYQFGKDVTQAQRDAMELARDVTGIGGDKAKLTANLSAGVLTPWTHASSITFVRELEQTNTGTTIAPKIVKRYVTHTATDGMFEAGSRRASRLAPIETRSLRAILADMYNFDPGENK